MRTWIDEGRIGQPKVYVRRHAVLNLIRRVLKEDVELGAAIGVDVDSISDDELFRIGEQHYSIYEQ